MSKKLISFGLLLSLIMLSGASCFRTRGPASGPASLTFYGLDDSDVFEPLIAQYREKYSSVRVTYKKFNDPFEFEKLMVNEIAEGEGPDVFYVHNTWFPRHLKKVVPLESETLTPQNFSDTFVNVAAEDFVQPDPADSVRKIYALPLYVDTLGLYYNKELFEQKLPELGKPPATWDELKEIAPQLREQSQEGILQKGAIALGRADNIRRAVDILYNLFLQAGVQFYDPEFKQAQFTREGQEGFDYFLSFSAPSNKNYSWSADLVSPTQPLGEVEAFLAGKVAMILGFSDLYPRLANDLKNVRTRNSSVISLNDVGIAPVPQIATDESDYRAWADYYGLAVSRNSKNQKLAWDFVQFMTSKERSRFYHQKTKRPTARRDLIEEQKGEPITEIFVSQVGYAGSFRIFDDERFSEFLKEAVNNALAGQSYKEALGGAQIKVNELLKLEAPEGLYPKPKKK